METVETNNIDSLSTINASSDSVPSDTTLVKQTHCVEIDVQSRHNNFSHDGQALSVNTDQFDRFRSKPNAMLVSPTKG
jgi:hypothetical protein